MKAEVRLVVLVIVSSLGLLIGCGSQSNAAPPQPGTPATVTVSPAAVIVAEWGTQQFTATVTGRANTAVTWSVREASGGAVSVSGLYYAPAAAGLYHVIATSVADPSCTASAEVTVPAVQVQIAPTATTIGPGTTWTFTAAVSGSVDHQVNWKVQEGASGGSITPTGLYSAPQTLGTYHIIATSDIDPTKSAIAAVTVAALNVTVIPPQDTLGPLGMRQFTAVLSASNSAGVNWWMYEGAAGGLLSSSGLYSANQQLGTHHIIAASVAIPNQSGEATVDVVPSGFRTTGNLRTARAMPRATLLQDGTVLVTGGQTVAPDYGCGADGIVATDSAELYDAALGTFRSTALMRSPRVWHSATMLDDGRVLLAGGSDGMDNSNSAEIYDPATGAFTLTGTMAVARSGHTATRLQDGKVLLTGGMSTQSLAVASAEIFDPATGMFTPTGSMAAARSDHTATLLPNGAVLITGGQGPQEIEQTAELYDPASGTFKAAGSMVEKRLRHSATLLADGLRVLIAGGSNGTTVVSSAEIYSLATGTFTPTGNMVAPHSTHSESLLSNGLVLIAGGDSPSVLTTAELYDPITGAFTQTGGLFYARSEHAAVLLKDSQTVLVAGGSLGGVAMATAELFK